MDSSKPPEEQYIIRFPPEVAKRVRKKLKTNNLEKMSMFFPGTDPRSGVLNFEEETFRISVADLPTVVETHKTPDNKSYYKSGDIGQILIVENDTPYPLSKTHLNDGAPSVVDGLTPPAKNIRKRKFRSLPKVLKEEIKEAQDEILKLSRGSMHDFEIEPIPVELIDEIYESSNLNTIITFKNGQPPLRLGVPSTYTEAEFDLLPQHQKELAKADELKRERELEAELEKDFELSDDLSDDDKEEMMETKKGKKGKKQKKKTKEEILQEEIAQREIAEAEQQQATSADAETIRSLRTKKVDIANEIGRALHQVEEYKLLLENEDTNPVMKRRFQAKLMTQTEFIKVKKQEMAEVDKELSKYNSL